MPFWPRPTELFALDRAVHPLVFTEEGAGPSAILLHGQPGNGHDWDRVVGRLDGRVRAIVPDRPGYGRTGGPAGSVAANADAVVQLLDRCRLAQATMVGYSWSGAIVLDMLQRHADRVAAAVLVSAVGGEGSIDDLDRLLASKFVGPLASMGGLMALRAERVRRYLAPSQAPVEGAAIDGLPDGWVGSWRSFVIEERALVAELPGITRRLAPSDKPVAVLIGTSDRVVRPRSQEVLGAALGADVIRADGCGHLLPLEAPDLVADAIVRAATE